MNLKKNYKEINKMWRILKFDHKNLGLLKKDLLKKLGTDLRIYIPKLRIQKYKNNKLINKEINLLGSYMFCFHESFGHENKINSLKFLKGLKYFLEGHSYSQDELKTFISECNKSEDKNGYINKSFASLIFNKYYKFKSGPFVDRIFKLINLNKEFIDIMLGNIKTKIKYNRYIIEPA